MIKMGAWHPNKSPARRRGRPRQGAAYAGGLAAGVKTQQKTVRELA
jgi:hypothetical protein